jgi:transposase
MCWTLRSAAWSPPSSPTRTSRHSGLLDLSGSPAIGGCGFAVDWPGACQLYRASGLSPAQDESAGKRRDGHIGRAGSVALRRALIDLGIGRWHADPAARRYGQQLRARGKKSGAEIL